MMKGLVCLILMLFATVCYIIWWNFPGVMGFACASYVSWKNYKHINTK